MMFGMRDKNLPKPPDYLAPARGVATGVILGAVIWGAVGFLIWFLL
jgi:hypothetical protein